MEDKFRAHEFVEGYAGIPSVATALAVIGCDVEAAYPTGDHIILVGRVQHVALQDGQPLIYYTRQFRSIAAAAS
jgi:flavin reductase (DIM6/NTAB) family NADH-FMN oxidoreductase RutF